MTPLRLVGVLCAAGLGFVYVGAVLSPQGQWVDDEIFGLAQRVAVGPLRGWLPSVARGTLPLLMGAAALVGVAWAVSRRRWRAVGAGALTVLVSAPASRLLREYLWRPDLGYSYPFNTLPSTHVTVVAALAVAIWMMVGARSRALAGVLIAVTLVAMAGNVVGHAHRPSDVLASVLLVGAVAGFVQHLIAPSEAGANGGRAGIR